MLHSDKCWEGSERMYGQNGGGTDETRPVKSGYLISDGSKGVPYTISEYV